MTQIYLIPIARPISQQFKVTLANGTYTFIFTWNDLANNWFLSINGGTGQSLIYSIPLIAGVNLAQQYAYTGISSLYIQNASNLDANPAFADLGGNVKLYTVLVT